MGAVRGSAGRREAGLQSRPPLPFHAAVLSPRPSRAPSLPPALLAAIFSDEENRGLRVLRRPEQPVSPPNKAALWGVSARSRVGWRESTGQFQRRRLHHGASPPVKFLLVLRERKCFVRENTPEDKYCTGYILP